MAIHKFKLRRILLSNKSVAVAPDLLDINHKRVFTLSMILKKWYDQTRTVSSKFYSYYQLYKNWLTLLVIIDASVILDYLKLTHFDP